MLGTPARILHPMLQSPRREGEASGDASGLQNPLMGKSASRIFRLLDCNYLVFLSFTDLDGLSTFRLD
jgi:hypothetical protein